MPKDNITKFHRRPCGNCGHTDMHGEVSGCVNMPTPASWCDCGAYVEPVALPYAGTSGYSGSSTSQERAERRDASGLTGAVQKAVLEMATQGALNGVTVQEARSHLGMHHGTVSGALSALHMVGVLERLTERRNRCQVYVLPENVNGRETAPHRSNAKRGTGPDPAKVREAIASAIHGAKARGRSLEDAISDAAEAAMDLL